MRRSSIQRDDTRAYLAKSGYFDKLLKINSPCTPHLRFTVGSNNFITKCTYPYKQIGVSYSYSFCVRLVVGDFKIGENAFA